MARRRPAAAAPRSPPGRPARRRRSAATSTLARFPPFSPSPSSPSAPPAAVSLTYCCSGLALASDVAWNAVKPNSASSVGRTDTWTRTCTSCWPTGSTQQLSRLRSEEHTSELQSHHDLVCRLLLEKKKKKKKKQKTKKQKKKKTKKKQ